MGKEGGAGRLDGADEAGGLDGADGAGGLLEGHIHWADGSPAVGVEGYHSCKEQGWGRPW